MLTFNDIRALSGLYSAGLRWNVDGRVYGAFKKRLSVLYAANNRFFFVLYLRADDP